MWRLHQMLVDAVVRIARCLFRRWPPSETQSTFDKLVNVWSWQIFLWNKFTTIQLRRSIAHDGSEGPHASWPHQLKSQQWLFSFVLFSDRNIYWDSFLSFVRHSSSNSPLSCVVSHCLSVDATEEELFLKFECSLNQFPLFVAELLITTCWNKATQNATFHFSCYSSSTRQPLLEMMLKAKHLVTFYYSIAHSDLIIVRRRIVNLFIQIVASTEKVRSMFRRICFLEHSTKIINVK